MISVGFITLLFLFSLVLRNSYLTLEHSVILPQPLSYAAFVSDAIAENTNKIVGPTISINQNNSSILLYINDIIPLRNYTTQLTTYETFLEDAVSNQSHSSINVTYSSLLAGELNLLINGIYNYTNNRTSRELLFTSPGSTNVSSYNINITVLSTRASLTPFNLNSSGDLQVLATYTDLNGTTTQRGQLFSSQTNSFIVDYAGGGRFEIEVGNRNGNYGSLWFRTTNVTANTSWLAVLPQPSANRKIGYSYNSLLNYSQPKISIIRNIGK